ncbi:MAG: hypothetical protein F6K16_05555 [Symploca sp. SIO2B6]|nr:hypothetical protein [Symploca sp. SIO2B6]
MLDSLRIFRRASVKSRYLKNEAAEVLASSVTVKTIPYSVHNCLSRVIYQAASGDGREVLIISLAHGRAVFHPLILSND